MNLIRYYNQNRKKIWGILIIIVSAFIFFRMISYIMGLNKKDDLLIANNTVDEEIKTNSSTLVANKSVVTGKSISNSQLKEDTNVIDKFISYCNNRQLEEAYNLLTDECKNQMYNTLEVFEEAYYNNVFNGQSKVCSVENWINDTYKVRIVDNILQTGKNNEGYAKQDYITVEKVDNEYKLNINNYIGFKKINKITERDNISVEVISRNTYMDSEEYTVKVTNNTGSTILLDSRMDSKTLYLQDSRGTKYSSYSHELTDPMLTIPSKQTKEITIKFYSSYTSTKEIENIVFSDLLLFNGELTEKMEFKADV